MKIIVTCGHPYSGADDVHRALVASGLADALPSRREGMTAALLHQRILKGHGVQPSEATSLTQIRPGKVWEDLAVDLFLGNLDRRQWGWEDPGVAWLLEFWAEFDPQVRFLLVYASPQSAAARALMTGDLGPHQVGQVLASWEAYQLEVLRFYHRHRERCLLANALALSQAPEAFIRRVGDAFQLDLRAANLAEGAKPLAGGAIATVLVEGLLGAPGESQALYAELEGYADLPESESQSESQSESESESESETAVAGWGRAWSEYRHLLRDLAAVEEALRAQSARCDELVLRGADTETELRGALQRQAGELARLQEEVASRRQRERHCEELERQLQTQGDALAAAQGAAADQAERNAQLIRDKDELLTQLHAVQAELETYFLRCEELSAAVPAGLAGVSGGHGPWGPMAPVEVLFDLRGEIDGTNWYYPEADGRWAGPEFVSTLRLPALGLGRYDLELQVVDAITPEILAGMRAFLNDAPLALDRKGRRYPATLSGQFSAEALPPDGVWTLRLEFPGVVSPADRGSDDRRHLAIRLSSVRMTAAARSGA